MEKEEVLQKIQDVFRKELKKPALELTMETTAKDVPGWDSLTHVVLIVEVEKLFKKRFSSKSIQGWQNIGDMVNAVLA